MTPGSHVPHTESAQDPGPVAAPTIYDVAKEAGVAPSTVSRTFSRPGRVAFETAERVRQAAEKLGYRSRPASRSGIAEERRTKLISLVMSDITNPVFFELIRGAEEAATQAGYMVLLHNTREDEQVERTVIEKALPLVDGVLMTSSRMSDSTIRMMAKQKPIVVVNRAVNGVPCVIPDNARGMRRAVEHLSENGSRNVLYVAGPEASWTDGIRWRALREAGMELELRVQRLGPFAPTSDGGAEAARAWLDNRVPSVICYNDQMALGFLDELSRHHVAVPQEVAVVGFDNTRAAALMRPSLTSVNAPMFLMGVTAVNNLLAVVRGAVPSANRPVLVPSDLVIRDSSTPLADDTAAPQSQPTGEADAARQGLSGSAPRRTGTIPKVGPGGVRRPGPGSQPQRPGQPGGRPVPRYRPPSGPGNGNGPGANGSRYGR